MRNFQVPKQAAGLRSKAACKRGRAILYGKRSFIVKNRAGIIRRPKIAIVNIVAIQIDDRPRGTLHKYLKVENAGVGDGKPDVQIFNDMVLCDLYHRVHHPALGTAGLGGYRKAEIAPVNKNVACHRGPARQKPAKRRRRDRATPYRASCTHQNAFH